MQISRKLAHALFYRHRQFPPQFLFDFFGAVTTTHTHGLDTAQRQWPARPPLHYHSNQGRDAYRNSSPRSPKLRSCGKPTSHLFYRCPSRNDKCLIGCFGVAHAKIECLNHILNMHVVSRGTGRPYKCKRFFRMALSIS